METAIPNIEHLTKLIRAVMGTVPATFNYGLIDGDGQVMRLKTTKEAKAPDSYVTWIVWRDLKSTPRRRSAVGIEFSGDDLMNPSLVVKKMIYGIENFTKLAKEFDEGGELPLPISIPESAYDEKVHS